MISPFQLLTQLAASIRWSSRIFRLRAPALGPESATCTRHPGPGFLSDEPPASAASTTSSMGLPPNWPSHLRTRPDPPV